MLNIYKVSDKKYPVVHKFEHYSSFVVITDSEESARNLNPQGQRFRGFTIEEDYYNWVRQWTDPKDVEVEYIGSTEKEYSNPTIISVSYHKL